MRKIITFVLGIMLLAYVCEQTSFFDLCKTETPAEIAAALSQSGRQG